MPIIKILVFRQSGPEHAVSNLNFFSMTLQHLQSIATKQLENKNSYQCLSRKEALLGGGKQCRN